MVLFDDYFLWLSYLVCSALSFLGAIFIILMYIGHIRLRSVFLSLLVLMQVADLIKSSSYFIWNQNTVSCKIQGFTNNFGGLSSIIWSSIIAYSIFDAHVINANQVFTFRKIYLIIGFGIPFMLSLIPFITNSYGDVGGYCWITNDKFIWRTVCMYGIVILAVIYNFRTYRLVIKEIRLEIEEIQSTSVIDRVIKKMLGWWGVRVLGC